MSYSVRGPWPHRDAYEQGLCKPYRAMPGCFCEWCEGKRDLSRDRRQEWYRRDSRYDRRLTAAEVADAKEVVFLMREYNYSYSHIAERVGCAIGQVYRWVRTDATMSRYFYDVLMALDVRPIDQYNPAGHRRAGAPVSPLGTMRRLQALWADGFPLRWIAEELNGPQRYGSHLWKLAHGVKGVQSISAQLASDIAIIYDKFAGTDPRVSAGVQPQSYGKRKAEAKRYGFAPSGCWDADTIDDPDAFPNWTGACGEYRGYTAHRRLGIPACQPCTDAVAEYERIKRRGKRLGESGV